MRPMLLSLMLAAACATTREAGSGTIAIKSFGYPAARPESYSVGKGVISGSNLQLRLDDGCVRGSLGREPIDLCRDPANPAHWVGTSGDVTAVTTPDGKHVNVQGVMILRGFQQLDVSQVIPLEDGSAWEELRKNPILLVLATTATDLEARRTSRR